MKIFPGIKRKWFQKKKDKFEKKETSLEKNNIKTIKIMKASVVMLFAVFGLAAAVPSTLWDFAPG